MLTLSPARLRPTTTVPIFLRSFGSASSMVSDAQQAKQLAGVQWSLSWSRMRGCLPVPNFFIATGGSPHFPHSCCHFHSPCSSRKGGSGHAKAASLKLPRTQPGGTPAAAPAALCASRFAVQLPLLHPPAENSTPGQPVPPCTGWLGPHCRF